MRSCAAGCCRRPHQQHLLGHRTLGNAHCGPLFASSAAHQADRSFSQCRCCRTPAALVLSLWLGAGAGAAAAGFNLCGAPLPGRPTHQQDWYHARPLQLHSAGALPAQRLEGGRSSWGPMRASLATSSLATLTSYMSRDPGDRAPAQQRAHSTDRAPLKSNQSLP